MNTPLNIIFDYPGFQKWEHDWIRYLLSDFQVNLHFDEAHRLVLPNSILLVAMAEPGNEQRVAAHLREIRGKVGPAGLIHFSDEREEAPIDFYDEASFVFRNYYRASALAEPRCEFFPIGYRSGLMPFLSRKPMTQRTISWSFAGQMKTSRYEMMEAANQIGGGQYYVTLQFDDPRALPPQEYAGMLNESMFVLCPRGFTSLDCFRLYEALEAGAIPIVEDPAYDDQRQALIRPGESYWRLAYGDTFPCPRVASWKSLHGLLTSLDIPRVSASVNQWWGTAKKAYRARFKQVISGALSS